MSRYRNSYSNDPRWIIARFDSKDSKGLPVRPFRLWSLTRLQHEAIQASNRREKMTRAQQLDSYIHYIAENYLDPLDDAAVAAMARKIDWQCQFIESKQGWFRVLFSDGSTLELDRLDNGALPSAPSLRIAMPLRD